MDQAWVTEIHATWEAQTSPTRGSDFCRRRGLVSFSSGQPGEPGHCFVVNGWLGETVSDDRNRFFAELSGSGHIERPRCWVATNRRRVRDHGAALSQVEYEHNSMASTLRRGCFKTPFFAARNMDFQVFLGL